jgi:hypothetical protein
MTYLCKDCKWIGEGPEETSAAYCHNEGTARIDLVYGHHSPIECVYARVKGAKCGPNGDLWEEKA